MRAGTLLTVVIASLACSSSNSSSSGHDAAPKVDTLPDRDGSEAILADLSADRNPEVGKDTTGPREEAAGAADVRFDATPVGRDSADSSRRDDVAGPADVRLDGAKVDVAMDVGMDTGGARDSSLVDAESDARSMSSGSLGANMGWVNGWDTTQHFADIAKHARRLTAPGTNTAIPLDQNKNPTTDFQLGVAEGKPNIATGAYALRFRGQATLVVGGGCSISGQSYDQASNVTTATVNVPDGNANVFFSFTNTWRNADHSADATGNTKGATDLSLARPGHDLTKTAVNSALAARLGIFRVIRPIHSIYWGNPDVDWQDRGNPGAPGWGDNYDSSVRDGAPFGANWEYLILLANETGKDLWITIPQRATDDYVTKLAQLFAFGSRGSDALPFTGRYGSTGARPAPQSYDPYNLDPAARTYPPLRSDLHLYVEWSNEVWNFGAITWSWLAQSTRIEMASNWQPNHAYTSSTNAWDQEHVFSNGGVYRCTTAGTSAASGGPTGTGSDIVDGTARWAFVAARSKYDPMKLGESSTGSGNAGQGQRHNAAMAVRNSLIFRTVFGDAAMMTRVRPVYASQLDWHALFSEGHDYLMHLSQAGTIQTDDDLGATSFTIDPAKPVSYYVWAYAAAPYINYFEGDSITSLDAAFASLNKRLSQTIGPALDDDASLARAAGVKLACYEGGQDLNHGEPYQNEVQSDPRIKQLTLDIIHRLTVTNADVADVFVYYTLVGNDNYGLSPDLSTDDTYKWQAAKEVASGL
jgi:hypothetical protein